MTLFSRNLILAVAVVGCAAGPASAQRAMGMSGGMPPYDTATETTLAGTVEEVKAMGGRMGGNMPMGRGMGTMDMMGMGGTHVVLKTSAETIEVHLGPAAFLAELKLTFEKGDQLEIVGSRVTVDGAPAVLARQVTREGRSFTLRDAQGVPAWSRGRRSGSASTGTLPHTH
jgi:hypothetical protein